MCLPIDGQHPRSVGRSEGLLPVVVGAVVGIVMSLSLGGVMASALFEVRAHDPRVLAASCLTLLIAASVACLGPLRRAPKTNAAIVLR
jgi:hypothetical protein